jgi:hypothetical protein
MAGPGRLLQALDRQLEEPGDEQGATVGAEQAEGAQQITAPLLPHIAI